MFMIETVHRTFYEFLVGQPMLPGEVPASPFMVGAKDGETGTHYLPGALSLRQALDANVH